jgi:hypothetical protein
MPSTKEAKHQEMLHFVGQYFDMTASLVALQDIASDIMRAKVSMIEDIDYYGDPMDIDTYKFQEINKHIKLMNDHHAAAVESLLTLATLVRREIIGE